MKFPKIQTDKNSITPHQDAARAAAEAMRTTMAERIASTDGCMARLQCAMIEAYAIAFAKELDAGADKADAIFAMSRAIGGVIASMIASAFFFGNGDKGNDEAINHCLIAVLNSVAENAAGDLEIAFSEEQPKDSFTARSYETEPTGRA
jgi:hypothetical protein